MSQNGLWRFLFAALVSNWVSIQSVSNLHRKSDRLRVIDSRCFIAGAGHKATLRDAAMTDYVGDLNGLAGEFLHHFTHRQSRR